MNKCIFLVLVFFTFSCKQQPKIADHPAYHNPTVQEFTDSIQMNPDEPQFYFLRAEALSNLNQDSLALMDVMQAAQLDTTNAQYLYTIGYLNLQLDKPVAAIKALKKNLDLLPGNVNTRLLLSKAYIANNNIEAALEETTKVLAAAPNHPGALFGMAQIKAAQKDTAAAIALAKQLLVADKNNYSASYQLADWYKAQGNAAAVSQYQYTFSLDTIDVNPLFEIGEFYEQQKQWEQAKQAYKDCFLKDLDFTDAYIQIGKILYQQDSTEKALRQFNIAISTAPNSAEAYLHKGLSFQKLNMKDSAVAALNQALVFDHQLQQAKDALKKLR